jgi:short subunit dehydrogenase-like uncharacterized protein
VKSRRVLIYGSNGYTGRLVVERALDRGLRPVLAGRNAEAISQQAVRFGLERRPFSLDDPRAIEAGLAGIDVVMHCAGPFARTSRPMADACLRAGAHYLDITGEIAVFEHAHKQHPRARAAGIVICPGVGFDVIPTDCVAAALKRALPDANELSLGFDSRSGFSPGTAKTSVEGLAMGGRVRRGGRIVEVPLAFETRRIDFGNGEKLAMTIPWGDIATAFYNTGIPSIEVFIPASPRLVRKVRSLNYLRGLLGTRVAQALLKKQAGKTVGPSAEARANAPTYVWGEVRNARNEVRTARLKTANGYSLTATGSLAVVERLMTRQGAGGAFTPAMLFGPELVESLPESGKIEIS